MASAFVGMPAVATPPQSARAEQASLTFIAALKYDRAGLLAAARAISTPGNPRYRNFLTVKQAAATFGATSAQRSALRSAATKLGMTVRFSDTGLTAYLTAPIDVWNELYGMEPTIFAFAPWDNYSYNDPATDGYPATPAALSPYVRLIFPSSSVIAPIPKAAASSVGQRALADDTPVNTGTPFGPGSDCVAPSAEGEVYSPSQIHVPYGTTALHERGLRGSGVRIANIEVGFAYNEAWAAHAAACFDYRKPNFRFTGGVGVPGPTNLQGEGYPSGFWGTEVQVIAAVVPEAPRIDYIEMAPGLTAYQYMVEAVDIVTTMLTPMPDVITSSIVYCEPLLQPYDAYRPVSDDNLALLATLGVTMLSASWDGGSSACAWGASDPPLSYREQAVAYPASSPWATGVGGTRIVLGAGNERVNEVAWNDTEWFGPGAGAGTGGPSLAARPWYQRPVTSQDRRLVPDVAAHASRLPGWAIAVGSEGASVVHRASTIAASAFTASNIALIAAAERKAGRGPLGFLNPLLYELAAKPKVYQRVYYDVTEGNNQRFIEAACCDATKGYDQATGLGALTFDELIKVIPKPGAGRR